MQILKGSLISRSMHVVAASLVLAALIGRAQAQEAPASGAAPIGSELQEVVVTATRRSERLQDVPISITALSQTQLDEQGLRSIDDLTSVTPGVTFQRMGSSTSANYNDQQSDISIRGIESQAGTSTTGIYIDDAPVQTRHIAFGSVNPFPALFDIDRVEVLRGPQGTLFGSSAEGGAVRFISPEPGLTEYSGYSRVEMSSIDHGDVGYNLGTAGGGPLIDGVLGFRASFSAERDGGWVDRASYSHPGTDPLTTPVFTGITEPNANWQQNATVRLALKWAPFDGLSVTPSIYYQRLHLNDTAAYWQNLSDPTNHLWRNGNALTDPSTDWFYLAGVKINWSVGWADFTSSSSYFVRQQNSVSDYTQYERITFLGAVNPAFANPYPSQPGDATPAPFADYQKNFFEEIRLASNTPESRLKWTAGLFYGHANENVQEHIYDQTLNAEFTALNGFPLCGAILGPCPNGTYLATPLQQTIDEQVAAFGELSLKVLDQVTATVGARVSHNTVRTESESTGGALTSNPGQLTTNSTSENPVTPKAVLAWQPDRDSNYYVSASKGYRVGGINGPNNQSFCNTNLNALGLGLPAVNGVSQWPLKYGSDSLWSYEIGAKNAFLDHKLIVDSSVYLIRWNGIQQNVYLPNCGLQFIANMGAVKSVGGDIDVKYLPLETLSLFLTAAYTDARFLESSCAGSSAFDGTNCVSSGGLQAKPIVSEGNHLLASPWNLHLAGEYHDRLPILGGATAYARLDYQVLTAQNSQLQSQDSRNAFFDNTLPGLPLSRELGARLGVRFNGFDVSLFGENLTDEHPQMFLSRDIPPVLPAGQNPPDNLYYARSVRPRTVGITATYRY